MDWDAAALEEALRIAFGSKGQLAQVLLRTQLFKSLNKKLEDVIQYEGSDSEVRFRLIQYLHEDVQSVESVVRDLVRMNGHQALYGYIDNFLGFLITYGDCELEDQQILDFSQRLSSVNNFSTILEAFNAVIAQLLKENKVALSKSIKEEIEIIKSGIVADSIKIFFILEILIRDFPRFAQSQELSLSRLFILLEQGKNPHILPEVQRAFLEIIVKPGALQGQVIFQEFICYHM